MRARKQYLEEVWKEYQKASKAEKGKLLSEAQRRTMSPHAFHRGDRHALVGGAGHRLLIADASEIDSWKTSYSLFARGECGEPAELNWDVGEGVDLEGLGRRMSAAFCIEGDPCQR